MTNTRCWIFLGLLSAFATPLLAQSFRVQCPTSTITHPIAANNNSEPAYLGPTQFKYVTPLTGAPASAANGYVYPSDKINGAIKCQQISGGDGYATMGDGTQTYLFSFGPLSGLGKIASGMPGTDFPNEFNSVFNGTGPTATTHLSPGDPAATIDGAVPGNASNGFVIPLSPEQVAAIPGYYNGAVGLANELQYLETIFDISEGCTPSLPTPCSAAPTTVTVILNVPAPFQVGDQVVISGTGARYDSSLPATGAPGNLPATPASWTVSAVNVANTSFPANQAFQFTANATGQPDVSTSSTATAASAPALTGHVDPRQIMDVGVMNGNIPAPLFAIDEDDEFFLTLTNVGMIMRPDLFEQHTVHFHGYPNASAFYDGVPDASVAINIAGSFTYYYLAPDAGTYFWHCHITPPEHLQMGMVGQLYVRPRQNRYSGALLDGLTSQQLDPRTACSSATDILCSNPLPAVNTGAANDGTKKYAYNDGDGSTYYDVEYPIQMHGFDPNFHFVGMTFNPEGFTDMKDKYFLLNGRSYPDTVNPDPLQTQSADGVYHFSQPLPAIVTIKAGQRALLRISNLAVTEYHTLASLGVPMQVIGYNAKLLRDQVGNNMYYTTNSITLGGGESLDVILDTCAVRPSIGTANTPNFTSCTAPMPAGTYYLYTPNLDHLSNDAENFGGEMTEVRVTM